MCVLTQKDARTRSVLFQKSMQSLLCFQSLRGACGYLCLFDSPFGSYFDYSYCLLVCGACSSGHLNLVLQTMAKYQLQVSFIFIAMYGSKQYSSHLVFAIPSRKQKKSALAGNQTQDSDHDLDVRMTLQIAWLWPRI